jgi:hypothetical protein
MATKSSLTSQFYSPEDFSSAGQAIKPQIEAFQQYEKQREPLLKEQQKASEQLATAKSEVEKTVAQAGVKAGDEYISGLENLQLQYQGRLSDNPLPTHKPTQEDLSTLAGLGSMIMTMGFLVGSGGKANAIAGLESLTGALNGWRSGRKDLWQQEMRNFEKSFAKVKADRDEIYKNLIEGQKLAATNYQAAKLKYETAARIAGANSIVTADLNKGRADQALKNLESSFKTEQGFTQQQQQMAMSLYRERQAEIRHQQNIASRERAAQIRAESKGAAGDKKTSGIGKVAEQKLEAKASLIKQYDSLIEDYQKNKDKYQLSPGLRTALSAIPGGGSVSEKMMAVARANPNKYPNAAALSQFIGKLESVIAPDRHSLYGANLTANELPRYERTVPRITDDPKVFLQFLESNRKNVEESLRSSQEFYLRRGVDLKLNEIYDKAQPFIATASGTPKFNTVKEAEEAGLPSGTKIIVGGKSATVE